MANAVFNCHSCGARVPFAPGDRILRSDECGGCGADLHCCRNCRFFDPSKNNQCAEPRAEWAAEKGKANFCDYFEPRTTLDLVGRSRSGPQAAGKAFDDLFK